MFSKPVTVGDTHLLDQLLDVLIQGIQLSLHHEDHRDQFFPAAVIQFFQCVFCCHHLLLISGLIIPENKRDCESSDKQASSFCLYL